MHITRYRQPVEKPDLIILDIMLPGGGGLHVLRKLRLLPGISGTPVVILTGVGDDETKQKILDERVSGYFQKPFDWEALSKAIKNILSSG